MVITDEDGMVQNLADIDMSTIATVGDLVTTLDGIPGLDASLDADGHLSLTTTVAGTGVALDASATDMGAGQTLTTEYGINAALTGTSAADIDVADWLDADSSRLAVATVSDDAALAVGDNAIASGDSSGVERLLSVLTEDVSIGAAGSLPATEGTLSAYAGDILGAAAVRLDAAESAATTTTSVLSTLEDRLSSETGVNLDEETARLEELQTAYEAGAQLLSIVQEMFDTLLDAVN